MIKLGEKVKDVVSEFIGIAVARTTWLYGCARIEVVPKVKKNNEKEESIWFDEDGLMTIGRGVIKKPKKKPKPTGGSRINNSRRVDAIR